MLARRHAKSSRKSSVDARIRDTVGLGFHHAKRQIQCVWRDNVVALGMRSVIDCTVIV